VFGALPAEVYGVALVFCRVGALVMLLPGIGEQTVPPRLRLSLAFVLALAFYPILRAGVPAAPEMVGDLAALVLIEILVGLALGALLRMFLATMSVAGEAVSLHTTLAFAQTANPGQAQPSTTLGTFLTVMGLTLIFATGLHHMFIAAMVKSYTVFPIGQGIPVGDFGQLAIRTFADVFILGIQLAAPVIVFSLVFYIAAGFVGRVMPQFQIFFVVTPLTVLLGLSLFAFTVGTMGLVWVDRFRAFLEPLT